MKITVKNLSDQEWILTVTEGDTIEEVMQQIKERTETPRCLQRLIFAGKQMVEEKTLKECGIQEGDTVHLVLRFGWPYFTLYVQPSKGDKIRLSVDRNETIFTIKQAVSAAVGVPVDFQTISINKTPLVDSQLIRDNNNDLTEDCVIELFENSDWKQKSARK